MIRNAFLAFAMNASNFVKHISNVTIVFFFLCDDRNDSERSKWDT